MSSVSRDDIVRAARAWVGTPYMHQGSLRGVGADCLGLVRGLWRELVGPEPEATPAYSPDWAEAGGDETLLALGERHFAPVDDWRAGDVLVFRFRDGAVAKHVGVATGATTMIHAHDGARVAEVALGAWRRRIVRAFAFPNVAQDSARDSARD